MLPMPFSEAEADGEPLFEALLHAFERSTAALSAGSTDVARCMELSASSLELHQAKEAMRAWIVTRAKATATFSHH